MGVPKYEYCDVNWYWHRPAIGIKLKKTEDAKLDDKQAWMCS